MATASHCEESELGVKPRGLISQVRKGGEHTCERWLFKSDPGQTGGELNTTDWKLDSHFQEADFIRNEVFLSGLPPGRPASLGPLT